MSLFGKLKQGLGIGTAKLELQAPAQVAKDNGEVKGKVILTGKSDQKVKSVTVKMLEVYTTGRGDDEKTKEYELGMVTLSGAFDLKKDERRELEFTLPFQLSLSSNQSLAEKKGALGMLGKAAVFAGGEKSEYQVKAAADLENVALDPDDTKQIRLV
jgi:sporulation-control protein spo0M